MWRHFDALIKVLNHCTKTVSFTFYCRLSKIKRFDHIYLQEREDSMAALKQDINARQNEFMKAFNGGNATGAASLYTADCTFMPHGREPIHGKASVEAYFKQDMAEGVKQVVLNSGDVQGVGEWAFERGTYELDGSRGQETGAYLQVWKHVGGKWLIYNDCFNVIKPAQG